MTDPLIYAALKQLRDKMFITRNEVSVTVIENAIWEIVQLNKDIAEATLEINRLNKELEFQKQYINRNWELVPKPPRPLEYGDDLF